jgi:uncharacterized protein YceK
VASGTRARLALFSLLLVVVPGCQTARSWDQGCPGIYSGVRFYRDQYDWLPVDGKIFFTIDLPLTALADTLTLPVSAFAKPTPPPHGWSPGCRWAQGLPRS